MTKVQVLGVLATVLPLACSAPEDTVDSTRQAVTAVETFKVGVLVDATSPARTNFSGAAALVKTQVNQAMAAAHVNGRFDVIVGSYAPGQAQAVAVDLINNQGVIAIVADTNDSTTAVNHLNYDFTSPIAPRHVTVTCYQCSLAGFNDTFQTDPAVSDTENWLFRTYYNASFETPLQAQIVLNRASHGDFDHDGFVKIVVYADFAHFNAAINFISAVDALYSGPHSVSLVFKITPSDAGTRAAEMAQIFDSSDGHHPDAVYLSLPPDPALEALGDYRSFAVTGAKPPLTAENDVRRNFLLPALIAAGGEGLEGSSVQLVSSSPSGPLFKSAFVSATGQQPELTSSFLYDATVAQVGAIGIARSNGTVTPELVQGNFPSVNAPGGTVIRPRVSDFTTAATRIKNHQPINYDGGSCPLELTAAGENYPDLVQWRIHNGAFQEVKRYQCDPDHPNCVVRP
jgi:hypothetical protein